MMRSPQRARVGKPASASASGWERPCPSGSSRPLAERPMGSASAQRIGHPRCVA